LEGRSVTGVKVKMQADDGHGQSAWDESGAFTVNNVNASPSINVGTPSSPSSGDISVAFTIADAESDSCSISAQYYADSAWQTATPASGQAMSGLSSSAGGTEHTFTWSSGSDLGGRSVTGVKVKMQADDGHSQSAWDESGPFTVDNAVVVTLQYKHTGGSLTDLIDGTVLSGNDIFLYSPVTGEIALEAIQYYIDGTYWGDGKTDSTPLGKRPWDTTEETNGDYTLEVRVWASGDVVATHSVSITISN